MEVKDILQFLFVELQEAIREKRKERVLDLGTVIDVLYEVAKKQRNNKITNIIVRTAVIKLNAVRRGIFIAILTIRQQSSVGTAY